MSFFILNQPMTYSSSVTESTSLSDTNLSYKLFLATVDESITVTDSIATRIEYIGTMSSSVTLGDTPFAGKIYTRSITSNFRVSTLARGLVAFLGSVSNGFTISDLIAGEVLGEGVRALFLANDKTFAYIPIDKTFALTAEMVEYMMTANEKEFDHDADTDKTQNVDAESVATSFDA